MSIPYFQKLKDPRWQKLRLEIFNRDEFSCQYCGDTENTLNVHHLSYNGNPWETDESLLITLCEDCHSQIDQFNDVIEKHNLKVLQVKKTKYNKGFSIHLIMKEKLYFILCIGEIDGYIFTKEDLEDTLKIMNNE